MRAINHALTGAVIGLAVAEPAIALPAAFCSHFVCDAIPHFGSKENDVGSRHFTVYLVIDASLCIALVIGLLASGSHRWLVASICAFLAASPDFLYLRELIMARRGRKFRSNRLEHWLKKIQWFEHPIGAGVEIVWALAMLTVVASLA